MNFDNKQRKRLIACATSASLMLGTMTMVGVAPAMAATKTYTSEAQSGRDAGKVVVYKYDTTVSTHAEPFTISNSYADPSLAPDSSFRYKFSSPVKFYTFVNHNGDLSQPYRGKVTVDEKTGVIHVLDPKGIKGIKRPYTVKIEYGGASIGLIDFDFNSVDSSMAAGHGNRLSYRRPVPVEPGKSYSISLDGVEASYVEDIRFGHSDDTSFWKSARLNHTTGEITGTVPTSTLKNDAKSATKTIDVEVVFKDHTVKHVKALLSVIAKRDSEAHPLRYSSSVNAYAADTFEIPIPSGSIPKGTVFSQGDGFPSSAYLHSDGSITGSLGLYDPSNKTITFPVKVTYPDKTTNTYNPTVKVHPQSEKYTPRLSTTAVRVKQGGSFKNVATVVSSTLPEHARVLKSSDTPSWVKTVTSDGHITGTIPSNQSGGRVRIPLKVVYKDNSVDTISFDKITVDAPQQSSVYTPKYSSSTKAYREKAFKISKPSSVPSSTKFSAVKGSTPSWVKVNSDGSITGTIPSSQRNGTVSFKILATYADKSHEEVTVTLNVASLAKETSNPRYGSTTAYKGSAFSIAKPSGVPSGAVFKSVSATPSWAKVASDGSIKGTVPSSEASASTSIKVWVTYSDKSGEYVTAPLTIKDMPQNNKYQPAYSGRSTVTQNHKFTISRPSSSTIPAGAKFSSANGLPPWVKVASDGTLTGTVPGNQSLGNSRLPIKVTYLDKTSETIYKDIKVVAQPQSEKYNPSYESTATKVKAGSSTTISRPTGIPSGVRVSAISGKTPSWVKVNSDGSLTISVPQDQKAGKLNIPVRVTYSDGTTDDIVKSLDVSAYVRPVAHDVTYGSYVSTVKQGNSFSISPARTSPNAKYSLGSSVPSWVKLSSDGVISGRVPSSQTTGEISVPVKVTYSDGTTQTVVKKINVVAPSQAETNNPTYSSSSESVIPGKTFNVASPTGVPSGSHFALASGSPDWIHVGANGSLTGTVPDVANKAYRVGVEVFYPDGSKEVVYTTINVGDRVSRDNEKYHPFYSSSRLSVPQGDTAVVSQPMSLPDSAVVVRSEATPSWVTVSRDGKLTMVVPRYQAVGDIDIPVVVSFADGSSSTIVKTVTISKIADARVHHPVFKQPESNPTPGDNVSIPAPQGVPEGTTFKKGDNAPSWVDVASDGSITATVPQTEPAGQKSIPVVVTYPDGSVATTDVLFTVGKKTDNQAHDPEFVSPSVPVHPGKDVVIPAPSDLPSGAKVVKVDTTPDWVSVNPDNSLTIKTTTDVASGKKSVAVDVVYPDGSRDHVVIPVMIDSRTESQTNSTQYLADDALYNPGDSLNSALLPVHVPDGASFGRVDNTPEWVTVNPDGSMSGVLPASLAGYHSISIPVKVVYSDGSSKTIVRTININSATTDQKPDIVNNPPVYNSSVTVVVDPYGLQDSYEASIPTPTGFHEGYVASGTLATPSWAKVYADGHIDVDIPKDVSTGVVIIPLKIADADGNTVSLQASITIDHPQTDHNPPASDKVEYPSTPDNPIEVTARPGDSFTVFKPSVVPEGATFVPTRDTPSWATVNPDGTIDIKVTDDTPEGLYSIPVEVHYTDGSSSIATVVVTIKKPTSSYSDMYDPQWSEVKTTPGKKVSVGLASDLPDASFVKSPSDSPSWVVINPDGTIVVDPPVDVQTGRYHTTIITTYPDGTSDSSQVSIDVVPADSGVSDGTSSTDNNSIVPVIAGVGVLVGVIAVVARLVTALPAGVPVADVGLILPNGTVIGGRYNSRRVNELDDHARYSGPFVY